MSKRIETAIKVVREHLDANGYSYGLTMGYLRCYRLFRLHLAEIGKPYSSALANHWLQSIASELRKSSFNVYRLALAKLEAAYHNRRIGNSKTRYNMQNKYCHLAPWCQDLLNEFIAEITDAYVSTSSYLGRIKFSVAQFLNYLQNKGVTRVEEISHRIIVGYYHYHDDDNCNYKLRDVYNNCIRKLLRYLSKKGSIQESIPLTLDKFVLSRLVFIESLPKEVQEKFVRNIHFASESAKEYYRLSLDLDTLVKQHKYSKTMRNVFHKTWKEFFIFLEANSLGYSKEMALTWADHMGQYTVQWKSFRRAFMIFEQYWISRQINPQTVYRYLSDRANSLPAWCKADYEAFMRLKWQEGFAKSTLDMYRSSCLRLLEYLNTVRISSWDAVTPETLKCFHRQDPHSTPEGKNAYTYKIRIFLEYLGQMGRMPTALFMALPCESVPRVSLIHTLEEDDIANLYQFRYSEDNTYNLRAIAMILIGLRMGLRASDITKLKFSDISWDQKTISIQQQKTGRFLKLPMPIEVGNALYRYIIEGRPDSLSEYIFISHKVPFQRLHRSACLNMLKKALPDNTHGFRITRKTFASRMLVKDVAVDRIADTLGHANNLTVMRYLSTNDDKMRMCAISLSAIPVEGGVLT